MILRELNAAMDDCSGFDQRFGIRNDQLNLSANDGSPASVSAG